MRVICVAGARPNYMKVKPVMDALEERGAQVILVHTGQHYDAAMSDVFFADLGIRRPDHFLGAGSGTHAVQTCRVMTAFEPLVTELAPDVVVVVGDVNSTLACALVTAKLGVPLAHVEAGLRSGDRSMPEEINRLVTDRVSDYLFAPSADAVVNLQAEGYRPEQIHLVGNVMVDTLLANAGRAAAGGTLAGLSLQPGQYGLVTLHRPANVDDPAVLGALLVALKKVSRSCPLVLPAHPRVAERLHSAGLPAAIKIIPSAGYLDFIALEASARLVLTDSGGVQEETTVLGVPCLTLRDSTERPITLTEGTNQLVGRDPDRIVKAALEVLGAPRPRPGRPALWDGQAGKRIAAALVAGHDARSQRVALSPERRGNQPVPRALITGITGQDGLYLGEFLAAKGYEVFGMVRGQSNPKIPTVEELIPSIQLLEGDLRDLSSLIGVLETAQPDEIYNLGAISFVGLSFKQPELTGDITAMGVLRILEAIRIHRQGSMDGVRFYQASSSEMFGTAHESPKGESTQFHPRSPYGVAKVFGHYVTQNYRECYNAWACSGILFNHESPRRGYEFLTRKVTRAVARIALGRQKVLAVGNMDVSRDWGFAGDYVEAMWLMLQQEEPDDYVIATGKSHSVRDLLQVAFHHVGIDDWQPYVVQDERFFRPADVAILVGDATKARTKLGWCPTVEFQQLIEMMVDADLQNENRTPGPAEGRNQPTPSVAAGHPPRPRPRPHDQSVQIIKR